MERKVFFSCSHVRSNPSILSSYQVQVKKSVVTQSVFIPQGGFTPQNEAGDERIRLCQDLNQSYQNYADLDAKIGGDFHKFQDFVLIKKLKKKPNRC